MAAVPGSNRWFGVGHSQASDAGAACARATDDAIAGRDAAILFVFTSSRHHFSEIVEAARERVGPETAIVGGTTFGEITPVGASCGGVVALALGGPGITVRTAVSRDANGRQREAGREVALAVGRVDHPHRVLMLIPDGGLNRQHEIVRGAYSVVGASVHMAGGCSADVKYEKTHQFYGNHSNVEVLSGGVVAVMIGSDGPIGVGMAHGWRRYGEPMSITSSDDTRIHEFDHKPALDMYLERIGADPSIVSDPAKTLETILAYPLGLARRSGEDIRIVHSLDVEGRSMSCYADVQQGSLAWLMETDRTSLIDSGEQACRQAISGLNGARPIGMFAFNCGVRKLMLADGVSEEVAKIVESALGAPVGGYYSSGEIARIRGSRGMHHLTAVSLAFG